MRATTIEPDDEQAAVVRAATAMVVAVTLEVAGWRSSPPAGETIDAVMRRPEIMGLELPLAWAREVARATLAGLVWRRCSRSCDLGAVRHRIARHRKRRPPLLLIRGGRGAGQG